jgi:hypothetical protein
LIEFPRSRNARVFVLLKPTVFYERSRPMLLRLGLSVLVLQKYQEIEAISLAGLTLRTRAKATTAIKLVLHSPRSTIPT